jgi:archaellum biogenesis ATPase FlaH
MCIDSTTIMSNEFSNNSSSERLEKVAVEDQFSPWSLLRVPFVDWDFRSEILFGKPALPEKEETGDDRNGTGSEGGEEKGQHSRKIERIKDGDEGVIVSAQELVEADLPEIEYAVPGLFPKGGVSLLVGPPKSGKSLLSMNLALAVARGGKGLGEIPVERGHVLLMSLEDGARRTKSRIERMCMRHEDLTSTLDRMNVTFNWKKFGEEEKEDEREGKSFLEMLLGGMQKVQGDYRLVIIDTLQRLRRQADTRSNLYVEDYEAMQDFQDLAQELDTAVLLLHHTNKITDAEDPYLRVSGSTGLTANADTVAVLEGARIEQEAELHVSGRDIPTRKLGIRLDKETLSWQLLGDAHVLGMGDVRQAIYDVLDDSEQALGPSDISDALEHVDYDRIKTELGRMVDAKQIVKPTRGAYATHQQESLF